MEKSKCCGAESKIQCNNGNAGYTFVCSKCNKPFEPQSIPLDRNEMEEKCCCYSYDCELGCRERQCCCIPEYTHKVKDHTPLKYRDFFEKKFPTPKLTPESTENKNSIDEAFEEIGLKFTVTKRESTEMEEWEKEFDRKIYPITMNSIEVNMLKDFISKLLSSHSKKLKEEYKKELIEKCVDRQKWYSGGANKPIRDGIDDIINIIKQ